MTANETVIVAAQLAVTRARHIIRRAARQGGEALSREIKRAVSILVAAGASLNEAIGFAFSVRRSLRTV